MSLQCQIEVQNHLAIRQLSTGPLCGIFGLSSPANGSNEKGELKSGSPIISWDTCYAPPRAPPTELKVV